MTLSYNGLFIRAKKAHVVSKRLDDFRERIQPQLGKVHDPIAETLNVDENHTFGVMVKADDFSESGIVPNTQLLYIYIFFLWRGKRNYDCTLFGSVCKFFGSETIEVFLADSQRLLLYMFI